MYVLGIGAANVDVHGMSRAAIVMRDSNPGHLRTSAGGVTRNVMENLARMGVGARMVSALGCDLFGELVRRESEAAGLDMSGCLMLPGVTSSAYVSILDERADMLVAMSDMSVLEHVTPEVVDSKRALILGAAAVVCDPCLAGGGARADPGRRRGRARLPRPGQHRLRAPRRAIRGALLRPQAQQPRARHPRRHGHGHATWAWSARPPRSYGARREVRRREPRRARLLLSRTPRANRFYRALRPVERDAERHRRGGRLPRRAGIRLRARLRAPSRPWTAPSRRGISPWRATTR